MGLSIGIVGLPNVGKSTLFNALTKKSVPAQNYPFCTIDPSVGIVAVPDHRLNDLTNFSKSKKTIPAAIEFVDIAGLVKGASSGEGLGNKFLANIRETDAIVEVVRIFEDGNIIHVDGKIDPIHDIAVINLELILADLQTVNNRLNNIEREVKRGVKETIFEKSVLEKIQPALLDEKMVSSVSLKEEEWVIVKQLNLLTLKPIIYALNKKAGGINIDELGDGRFDELKRYIKENLKSEYVVIDAKIEEDLKDFTEEEKVVFKEDLNSNDGIDELIKMSYKILSLITFFTTGEDETRAWTIKNNTNAKDAGSAIHTDFTDKFICAEIINYESLLKAGSYPNAKEQGLLRTEGKEYIVKDGDVVEFRI
jgi:GTP-binding protein YchF